jgi:predicted nucleic acid-binding Zn ribbon protein
MTYEETEQSRRMAILKNEPVVAKGRCHYCAFAVPPKAIYCCQECARNFQAEQKAAQA